MAYPAAPKVQAASVTAAASGAALWILSRYVFRGAVPDGVASLVYAAVPGVLAFAAGWLAPHQDRPHEEPGPLITVRGHDLTEEQAAAVKAALEGALPQPDVRVRSPA